MLVSNTKLLSETNFRIAYKPGRLKLIPDLLSRRLDLELLLFSSLVNVAPTGNIIARIRTAYPRTPLLTISARPPLTQTLCTAPWLASFTISMTLCTGCMNPE
jgi:hypothetical protein